MPNQENEEIIEIIINIIRSKNYKGFYSGVQGWTG